MVYGGGRTEQETIVNGTERRSDAAYDLFVDDERDPPRDGRDWTVARSVEEAVALVGARGLPRFISFDHDLGEGGTGQDFARWLVEHCLDGGLAPDFSFYVHSQNPVGAENIRALLDRFKAEYAPPGAGPAGA